MRRYGSQAMCCGAFFASALLSSCVLMCCDSHAQSLTDRFDRGLSSWQSYPLAQDVGYDPSVYTEQKPTPAIVRDLVNEGEVVDQVGLIRSVHIKLVRESIITLSYTAKADGHLKVARVLISSSIGKKYDLELKPEQFGERGTLKISGLQLGLPAGGVEADAIVVAYTMRGAALGSHSYLKLSRFTVESPATDSITLISPKTEQSTTGTAPVVADIATAGVALTFIFDLHPERVEFLDGDGKPVPGGVVVSGKKVVWTSGADARPGLWTIKARVGQNAKSWRVLVLPKEAAKDGGGILSQSRLKQIKDDPAFAGLRKQIRAKAEKSASLIAYNPAAGDNVALLPRVSLLSGLEGYLHLMTNYGGAIAWNALDYHINGNADSFEHARKALLTVSQWKTWTPTWFIAHGIQTYYVVGVFTEQIAFGYNLIGASLTPEEREQISSAIWSKSIRPTVQDYYLSNRMPTGSSNHMAHSVGGAIAAWVAIDTYDRSWRQKHGVDLAALIVAYEDLLRGLFPGDGSEAEPAGYDNFAMEGMSYGAAALDGLEIAPQGIQRMEDSFWWLRYARATPHLTLDMGDTSPDEGDLYGLSWFAEHSSDTALQYLYQSSRAENITENAPNLLDLVCCTKPIQGKVLVAPSSRIFAARGSVALRSGWGERDTVFAMRLGPWMNHEHHDQGSFQIASDGDLLVGEGGYADYYHDPNYKSYFTRAPAHNTILIDHYAFSQSSYDGRYWKSLTKFPRIERSFLGDHFDYVHGDLGPAYGSQLSSYRRTVVYLKPGLFVVDDELKSPTSHVFTWQLHPAGKGILQGNGMVKLESSRGKAVAMLTMANRAGQWNIKQVPNPVSEFENLDVHEIQKRYVVETDSPSRRSYEFLESIAIGGRSTQANPSRIETSTGRGFRFVEGDVNSIFLKSTRKGQLVMDGVDVDGSMMAVVRDKGGMHIFADDARSLRLNSGLRLNFSRAVLFTLDVHGKMADLKVSALVDATKLCPKGVSKESGKTNRMMDKGQSVITLSRGETEVHFEMEHGRGVEE